MLRRLFSTLPRRDIFFNLITTYDTDCVSRFKDLINTPNRRGDPPLHFLVRRIDQNNLAHGKLMVKALLDAGADPAQENKEGKTAALLAQSQEIEEMIHAHYLRQKGGGL